jgi:hypothetical protein
MQRFTYNNFGLPIKLTDRVEFPQRIDLRPYTKTGYGAAGADAEHEWYRLVAAIVHIGTVSGGHYYAYANYDGQWCKLNDQTVTSVAQEEMEKGTFGGGSSYEPCAYMLTYEREGTISPEVLDSGEADSWELVAPTADETADEIVYGAAAAAPARADGVAMEPQRVLAALRAVSESTELGPEAPALAQSLSAMVQAVGSDFAWTLMSRGAAGRLEPLEPEPEVETSAPLGAVGGLERTSTADLGRLSSLTRTSSLSKAVVSQDEQLLRRAELFDEGVIDLFLALHQADLAALLADLPESPTSRGAGAGKLLRPDLQQGLLRLAAAALDFFCRVVARFPQYRARLPEWRALLVGLLGVRAAAGVSPVALWVLERWAGEALWGAMFGAGGPA